jgi:hypothetical protein
VSLARIRDPGSEWPGLERTAFVVRLLFLFSQATGRRCLVVLLSRTSAIVLSHLASHAQVRYSMAS